MCLRMEDAFGLVDCPRFAGRGMDDLGLDMDDLGLDNEVDAFGLDKGTDALGLEKALEEPSASTEPLESTPSSTRARTSLLRIVLIRVVGLVIEYLQPLHELQIVLGTALDQPLHVDVLRVTLSARTCFGYVALQKGTLKDLVILGELIGLLRRKIHLLHGNHVSTSDLETHRYLETVCP